MKNCSKNIEYYPIKIFTGVYVIILAINFFWFISGGPLLEEENHLRIVLGSLMIFILPGLLWGEVLGFRSNHFLETVALSFALTLTIEIILLPVPFLFHATIRLWIALLFILCITGVFILIFKIEKNKELEFISPLFNSFKNYPSDFSNLFILLTLFILSYGTYRWGENITDIDGEKLIHLTYLRYYFNMPMVLKDLSITRGVPPQNLIHLWEYLLAAWSSLINMDPLPLFYRSRFVIPFLGFSSMYLLIRNIFLKAQKSEIIFLTVLFMCLGWFALLSPSSLDWIKQDPLRGILSFMGSAHHADTAMEIFIPLNAGLFLLAYRYFGWRSFLLLSGVLTATFMWHVREFFQTGIYSVIFGITLLLTPTIDRRAKLKKWARVMVAFVVVGFIFVLTTIVIPKHSGINNEMEIKEIALSYALLPENILGVRSLFHFPVDLRLTRGLDIQSILNNEQIASVFKHGWNYFLWLILSAFAIPLIAFLGEREDKQLSLFYILLWFLVLCWNFSMLLLIVFTYSEINFTTPRMMYIFSYIMIANSLYFIYAKMMKENAIIKDIIIRTALLLSLGLILKLWWVTGLPLARMMSILLSIIAIVSFVFLLLPKTQEVHTPKISHFWISVLGIFLFFLPLLSQEYIKVFKNLFTEKRVSIGWFSDRTPFGFSKNLIHFIKNLPPQRTFLVDPLGKAVISIYSPQYTAVLPEMMGSTIIMAHDFYSEAREGRHPLFKTNLTTNVRINPDFITKHPEFKTNFHNWKGPDSIKNDIAKAAPPMVLHGFNGDFLFSRKRDKEGNIIRVSPLPDKIAQRMIQFGYSLKDNGFDLQIKPGEEVIFVVSARLSGNAKKPAQLFIVDLTTTKEISRDNISESTWKEYVVRKTIRDNFNFVAFGIAWQPEKEDEWIEIKNIRIYIVDSLATYYKVPDHYISDVLVNHEVVKDWLNQQGVEYLLIQKDYYSKLIPYFQHYDRNYKIVFNNKDSEELIVHYLRTPL
jgi:hypothetical protein